MKSRKVGVRWELVRHERAWSYRKGVRNCARDGGGLPGRLVGAGSKPP
jgi:hypothetical protein